MLGMRVPKKGTDEGTTETQCWRQVLGSRRQLLAESEEEKLAEDALFPYFILSSPIDQATHFQVHFSQTQLTTTITTPQ